MLTTFAFMHNLKGQTINILAASDSSGGPSYCTGSLLPAELYIYAETSGYSASDAPTISIDFGDGTDTTYLDPNFGSTYPNVWAYVSHLYSTAGSYDVTYIITMPDLQSDTVTVYSEVVVGACSYVSGYIYSDVNTNCTMDGPDSPLQLYVVAKEASTGNYLNGAIANASGYYEILVPTGMLIDLQISSWSASLNYVCPASGILSTSGPSTGNDFAVDCSSHDMEPYQWNGFFHPGFTEYIKIGVNNLACGTGTDVQLRVVISDPLVTFVSGIADGGDITPAVSGDTLTWDIPAAYISNYIYLYGYTPQLTMWFTTDASAPLGSNICVDVIAEPIAGDLDPTNNLVNMCFPVLNGYDPNYIEVTPHGTTDAGLIDPNLEMVYTVHFQNTGNFPATNILIKDTLDLTVLDLSSFEFMGSSHAVTNIISSGDGAMVFEFDGINLPDSTSDEPNSHGWITYRIKQQPNLVPTTTIENTAHIYFDFNAPIVTNTALNTIKNPMTISENSANENHLSIYPVPASGMITVITNSTEVSFYQIFDMNGNILLTGAVSNGEQISIENLANGIYFFRTTTGATEKLIVNN